MNRDAAGLLSELLRTAVATRPEAIFARIGGVARDGAAALRAGGLDALADHYAARLAETDLPAGTRLMALAAPEPRSLATIVGALRVGFDVALAPPALDVDAIAAAAEACGANVLAGPGEFAEVRTGERMFEAAARLEAIRLVAVHGSAAPGALALDGPREDDAPIARPDRESAMFTVDVVDGAANSRAISARRAAGIAREFVARSGLLEGQAIVSLISLASEAGLVGGAFVPLIGGAHMIWHAPFSARRFFETLETSAPAHLFAPAGVASELGEAGILTSDRIASLTLVLTEGASAPALAHRVDPARVFFLRATADAGLRIEASGQ